jgi:hypothetical protein
LQQQQVAGPSLAFNRVLMSPEQHFPVGFSSEHLFPVQAPVASYMSFNVLAPLAIASLISLSVICWQ